MGPNCLREGFYGFYLRVGYGCRALEFNHHIPYRKRTARPPRYAIDPFSVLCRGFSSVLARCRRLFAWGSPAPGSNSWHWDGHKKTQKHKTTHRKRQDRQEFCPVSFTRLHPDPRIPTNAPGHLGCAGWAGGPSSTMTLFVQRAICVVCN
ncbi:hypothetical protein G7046_g7713 [Stylonectria norvegica]|nr:hypothetical protein G7046_g7713 [Stylonectria norvegica]